MLDKLKKEIEGNKNPEQAKVLQRFFKTGKGEYGEGDIFFGIKVPIQREIVKRYWRFLTLREIQELLNSKIHEERMIGILTLVETYNKSK